MLVTLLQYTPQGLCYVRVLSFLLKNFLPPGINDGSADLAHQAALGSLVSTAIIHAGRKDESFSFSKIQLVALLLCTRLEASSSLLLA